MEQGIAEDVICISCKEPALPKCRTEAGRREVLISKLCEPCWFKWAAIEPEDEDSEGEEDEEWMPL